MYQISGSSYDYSSLIVWQVLYQTTRWIKNLFSKKKKEGKWFGRKGFSALKSIYCTEGVAFLLGFEEFWTYDPKKLYCKFKNLDLEFKEYGK